MRLFIAINLPKEVKDYLFDLEEEFRDFGKFNFVAKKNLHLTLKFLGNINENQLKEIKERLKKIKSKSFEVSLNKLGIYPNEEFIRILWIDLNPKDKILELANNIDYELIQFPNDHPFSDHITIARVKFMKDKEKFIKKLKLKVKQLSFKANSFELMKSDLSKDGSQYTVLEAYSLE